MPKNSSISTRTSASLMPTSSVQIARTNFIVSASIDQSPLLAEECAGGQTFSTDARAGRGALHARSTAAWRRSRQVGRGTLCDAVARLAADPRQPHPANNPGDRRTADGPAGSDAIGGGDSRAQPDLHVQPDDAGTDHRLIADDGDGARPALQRRPGRAPHIPRRAVADRRDAAALLVAAVARRGSDACLRHLAGTGEPGSDVS